VNFQNHEPFFVLLVGIIIGVIIGRFVTSRPLFRKGFLEAKLISEYENWATSLSVSTFRTLVWAVGDFSCRAPSLFLVIDGELDITKARENYIFRRALLALQTIAAIGSGEDVSLAEFKNRVWSLSEEFREGAEHSENTR